MKTYYFNTNTDEYKILAQDLVDALEQLVKELLARNEIFHVLPYYYCDSAEKIPRSLYNQYLSGYSF